MHPLEEALFGLVKANDFENVKLQLESGVFNHKPGNDKPSLACIDAQGHSILHLALSAADSRILRIVYYFLCEYKFIQTLILQPNYFNLTPMHAAVANASLDTLHIFLAFCHEQHIDIKIELIKTLMLGDGTKCTSIQKCVRQRDATILLALLGYKKNEIERWQNDSTAVVIENRSGLDLTQIDSSGNTLSHLAARSGQAQQLQLLIQLTNAAHLEMRNQQQETVLLCAMYAANPYVCVRFLLQNKVDITVQDAAGDGLIHLAALHPDHQILELVLAQKLPLCEKNNMNKRPVEIAAERGYVTHVQRFLECGAGINTEIGLLVIRLIREHRINTTGFILLNARLQGPVDGGVKKVEELKDFFFANDQTKQSVIAQIRYHLAKANGEIKTNLTNALSLLTLGPAIETLAQEPISSGANELAVVSHSRFEANTYLALAEEIISGMTAKLTELETKYDVGQSQQPISASLLKLLFNFITYGIAMSSGVYLLVSLLISLVTTFNGDQKNIMLDAPITRVVCPWKCANFTLVTKYPKGSYPYEKPIYFDCSLNFSGFMLLMVAVLLILAMIALIYFVDLHASRESSIRWLSSTDKQSKTTLEAWLTNELAAMQTSDETYAAQIAALRQIKESFVAMSKINDYRVALLAINTYLRNFIVRELEKKEPKQLYQHDLRVISQLFKPAEVEIDEEAGMKMQLLQNKQQIKGYGTT